MFIIANPFDWCEVSLRYADINTAKYSPYPAFSGDQTYKDKSFNLKVNLIKESNRFPGLSIGFRDFIGSGKFSGNILFHLRESVILISRRIRMGFLSDEGGLKIHSLILIILS